MHMKDLSSRCMIDMSVTEKNDKRLFYFKPESILLKDVETQKAYRENLINNITNIPRIIEEPLICEVLTNEIAELIKDQSEPDAVRAFLANYYQRRAYNLQQKKYKVLLRWAHFGIVRIIY